MMSKTIIAKGFKKVGGKVGLKPSSFPHLPSSIPPEELLKAAGGLGLTNGEVAQLFGLSESQLSTLLHHQPHLQDILSDAKENPNRRVEASLYRRALGYQTQEIHKVHGKPSKVIIKEVAPEVVACIFWLKNRDPKRWRDTLEVRHTLRDTMDRAHAALRLGHGSSGALLLPPGQQQQQQEEEEGENT